MVTTDSKARSHFRDKLSSINGHQSSFPYFDKGAYPAMEMVLFLFGCPKRLIMKAGKGMIGWAWLAFVLLSCSQQTKDSEIKADIATKAKEELSLAGVSYTVKDGVVSLSGMCPTQQGRTTVESTVKKIAGVKDVVNNTTIGPVELNADLMLKQSMDSAFKKYNELSALVQNSHVILTGRVHKKDLPDIDKALHKLVPGNFENQLVVEE